MKIFLLTTLLFFQSCAQYVNQMHRQIDRDENYRGPKKISGSKNFKSNDPKRQHPERDKRPIANPLTYSLSDSGPSAQMRPQVKRQYRPSRMNADDFKDNEQDGSLWANQGSSSSLFTYQNDKHTGDMVIINVLENLKNQISNELKRAYPDAPKKTKEKESPDKAASATPSTAPQSSPENEMDMKVYDKISSVVAEEVSKDYIMLRGQKEVIFKKEKRSIEVQALVSRKDIMENDYVNSDKLLESRVYILRDNE